MNNTSLHAAPSDGVWSRAKEKLTSNKAKLSMVYVGLMVLLYLASFSSSMADKGVYVRLLSFINLVGIAAFYLQFPLVGRFKSLPLFKHIDWSVGKHKTMGYWLGGIFFLHPFLILAPKFWLSQADGWLAIQTAITAPKLLTGIIAWVLMLVWVIFSALKNKLPMRYEIWWFLHSLGFIIITVLVTLHITSVGSHGQLQSGFNACFWILCCISIAGALYNYLVKPISLAKSPFEIVAIEKVSRCDWQLTLSPKNQSPQHQLPPHQLAKAQAAQHFDFKAGQFVWLNTHKSAHDLDYHPFSISSCTSDLPSISFIIRELGDYTKKLHTLGLGQTVYVDGPYGQLCLDDCKKLQAVILIAGGAGLGPMLSLLRQLHANRDSRPIRLIYGNREWQHMSMLDEIKRFENEMANFKATLVCQEGAYQKAIHQETGHQETACQDAVPQADTYHGVIDQTVLTNVLITPEINMAQCGVYLCGPKGMIDSVCRDLNSLGIKNNHIHFEQLSF